MVISRALGRFKFNERSEGSCAEEEGERGSRSPPPAAAPLPCVIAPPTCAIAPSPWPPASLPPVRNETVGRGFELTGLSFGDILGVCNGVKSALWPYSCRCW